MNYLLDSHTLIWALYNPEKLSVQCRNVLESTANEIHVSYITFWEISLKFSLGKIELPKSKPEDLPEACKQTGYKMLQLTEHDVSSFYKLPSTQHKDPFDRMLIWQAINRNYYFLSRDRGIALYKSHGLKLVW